MLNCQVMALRILADARTIEVEDLAVLELRWDPVAEVIVLREADLGFRFGGEQERRHAKLNPLVGRRWRKWCDGHGRCRG